MLTVNPNSLKSGSFELSQIELWLFYAIALAFLTQPTDFRILSYSVPMILILLLIVVGLFKRPGMLTLQKLLVILPATGILIINDFLSKGEPRSAIYFSLLVFVTLYSTRYVNSRTLSKIWSVVAATCFILTLIGAYRFVNGFQAEQSENLGGFVGRAQQYVYFGISYLPSTRNSDALYFAVGAAIFLWRILSTGRQSVLNYFGLAVTLGGSVMSLSRGVWVALLVGVLAAYGVRRSLKAIVPLAVPAIAVLAVYGGPILELLENAVLSLIDVDAANTNVRGFYTYSNDSRIFIYKSAVFDFLSSPFGNGVAFLPSYSEVTGATSVHSENLYLDILLTLGVFGIPLIWLFIVKILQAFSLRRHDVGLGVLIGVLLGVYGLFNGGIDFVFFWYVLALWLISVRSAMVFSRDTNVNKS
jgi:hypothetical protein